MDLDVDSANSSGDGNTTKGLYNSATKQASDKSNRR
jgi:hypothetical protein